jgi:hypothetical protein|uniref:Peptidase A2 domain-containing protein n=1 Tax=Sipha flava TaxID=143950 RepID=A0A2S2R6D7_9HEMI
MDSGSSCNIITKNVWEKHNIKFLKKEKFVTQKLFSYENIESLKVVGKLEAEIKVENCQVVTDFYIVDGSGPQLLGRETSIELDILKIGMNINNLVMKERMVFQGTGKFK